jgi:Inhibitor of vertebrate lysozyme (Ivy)
MTQLRLVAALAALLVAAPALATEPAYLFDALHEKDYVKTYRAAWEKLMKDVQPEPDWLVHFNRDFEGVSSALAPVTVAGKVYTQSFVCKPEDCAGHRFVVLFDPGATRAVGALGGKGQDPEFFGDPSADEKEAIGKGLGG